MTSRCQVVISLTALCNPAQYSTIPLEVIDASFTHLLPLVTRCAERKLRLIHFSTAEVYGRRALDAQGEPTERMSEDDSCFLLGPVERERWTYSCAKQLLERVIWAHGQHGALPFTIIRPFNTIGARMDYLPGIDGEGTPRVLACFMNALLRGQPLPLVNGGQQRRAFMDVSDMVEAVCRVLERPKQSNGQIFNLGNPDNDVSIEELGANAGGRLCAAVRPSARLRASKWSPPRPSMAPATTTPRSAFPTSARPSSCWAGSRRRAWRRRCRRSCATTWSATARALPRRGPLR